ncbi:hypothetical protein BBU94A_0327 [Borreliella burgdorferi 94a]|uniref:Uncharacterized protein n=1 Tax=Borreliella burgdorferi (strain ZS7) TaxID=445985 RepID=A0A0H3C1H4_BORBZ|nr:hypothetical protein BbuZS7_0327 [Borreliella burgdorferi ZS7]AXK70317.1 hypothetical protein BbuMM1_03170 [Borreliella burgdorferi]EEC21960.1 hypothetical protein Bbu156a_0556 [Borreliella burgdorferi 156a]EEG99742.1 hypothetical protein BBU94A_0327 [Borreliella burgdorferi 94a]EEH31581.1 hypothetical protein BBUBOL26_0323 [Borreliella burgdorferi Bol26]
MFLLFNFIRYKIRKQGFLKPCFMIVFAYLAGIIIFQLE